MIIDIVDSANCSELSSMAKKLRYDALINIFEKPNITESMVIYPIKCVSPQIFLKKKLSEVVCVRSSELDRAVLERGLTMMYGFEVGQRKDFTHQRGSGLNQVLCEIAHQKNVIISFSLKDVFTAKSPATILGRMIQNIRLCQKFGVSMLIGSFAASPWEMRAPREVQALFMELGVKDVKKCMELPVQSASSIVSQ